MNSIVYDVSAVGIIQYNIGNATKDNLKHLHYDYDKK